MLDLVGPLAMPSFAHPFGTDALGDDVLVNLARGAGVTLSTASLASALAFVIGVSLGSASALAHRTWVDHLALRISEAVQILPQFLIVAVVSLVFRLVNLPDWLASACAMATCEWLLFFRHARLVTLRQKTSIDIEGARAIGCGSFRILFYHLWPNLWPEMSGYFVSLFPQFILLEAFLGFVGLSSPHGWGSEIHEGWKYVTVQPGLLIGPCVTLFLTNIAIHYTLNRKKSRSPSFTT